MKTAISIPDSIFEAAESLASSLGISRSELFTKAVADFIEQEKYKNVTARLNEVYARNSSSVPADILTAQRKSIGDEKWVEDEAW